MPFADVFVAVPSDQAGVDGIGGNVADTRAAKRLPLAIVHAHGGQALLDGTDRLLVAIHLDDHLHDGTFSFVWLQGWEVIDLGPLPAIRRIGHKSAGPDGLFAATFEPLGDHLVFAASHKAFKFGQLLIHLVIEIVDLFGGDDEGVRGLKGSQDQALVPHIAAAQTVDIDHQDRLIFAFGDIF